MEKRIKMVFVTQNLAPFRVQWLNELGKYIDIKIFHLNDYDSTVNAKYLSFVTDNLEIDDNYSKIGKYKFFKVNKILKEKADLLMLDGYGFIGQIVLIMILKLLGKKFYISVDGGFINKNEKRIRGILKRFCINSAKGFFSTCEETDKFISHYAKKDVVLYRHYFSSIYSDDICRITSKEKEYFKKKYDLQDKFVVIAVGRFIHIKGFDILLKAAKIAEKDICFVFVGGKPTEEYNDLIKGISSENVRFIDFLDKEKLKEYYFASDIFAMPSRGDIWGLVIGEAMAYGLPVLSSDTCIAGLAMVKDGENGYIVSGEDPEEYYSKVLELKNNENLYNNMVENNFKSIQKYAIDISVKNDLNNINEILNRKVK